MVVDICPDCAEGDLGLSNVAFLEATGASASSSAAVDWSFVPCDGGTSAGATVSTSSVSSSVGSSDSGSGSSDTAAAAPAAWQQQQQQQPVSGRISDGRKLLTSWRRSSST